MDLNSSLWAGVQDDGAVSDVLFLLYSVHVCVDCDCREDNVRLRRELDTLSRLKATVWLRRAAFDADLGKCCIRSLMVGTS